MNKKFEGFVLAGGKSSRMGADKAFLQFGGETFLERAVNVLKDTCSKVKIVINASQSEKFKRHFPALDFVYDIYSGHGAPGGIHAALKNCETEFAIILACDLPFVTGDAIKKLAKIAADSNKTVAAFVPHQTDSRPQPLCAVYRVKDCLPKLKELLTKEISASVRDFLQLVPVRFVEMNELTVNEENLFFNVNQPFDYEKIER